MTAARRSRGAAVAVAFMLAASDVAWARAQGAEPPALSEATRERAKVLVERGAAAYERGDYEVALAAFQDAAATYASPDFHFNIGLCHERLGEYGAAARSFDAYLRNRPDAPDRSAVEHRIELLRALAQREAEASETIATSGAASTGAPWLAGEAPMVREGVVERAAPASPSDRPPPTRDRPRSGRGAMASGALLLGAGVGLAIGGGVGFDVLARRRSDRVEDVLESGNPEGLTWAETRALAREGDRFRGLQIGAVALGATLAVVGIVLLAVGRRRAATARGGVALAIARARASW